PVPRPLGLSSGAPGRFAPYAPKPPLSSGAPGRFAPYAPKPPLSLGTKSEKKRPGDATRSGLVSMDRHAQRLPSFTGAVPRLPPHDRALRRPRAGVDGTRRRAADRPAGRSSRRLAARSLVRRRWRALLGRRRGPDRRPRPRRARLRRDATRGP